MRNAPVTRHSSLVTPPSPSPPRSSTTITLPFQWQPRPYQRAAWEYLRRGGKRAVICAHRRWGKDELSLHATACAAHERIGNYAHMLPEYAQARKAIWDAVNPHTGQRRIDAAFPLPLRKSTHEQEMKIVFKGGSTWQVVGSDHYDSLMGTSYAGIVKSEEAISNPNAWAYLSPILRENDGWVIFISTPRGHNHFEALLKTASQTPSWYAVVSAAQDTDCFTPEQLQDELRMLQDLHGPDYGRALWRQEYFCAFDAAIPGSIWGDCLERAQQEGRLVTPVPVDLARPVHTAWDLGRTDDTAIWFYQVREGKVFVLDHHASNFKDIPYYMQDVLLAKRALHGWTYGTHWLPHDARPRTLAAGGKSILQQCLDTARQQPRLGRFAIAPRLDRQEGIQAGRATLAVAWFDTARCAKGLDSLRQYHREWDGDTKVFLDVPAHDHTSHDADAWRYLSVSWRQDARVRRETVAGWPEERPPLLPAPNFKAMVQRHFLQRRQAREWASMA